MTDQASVQRWAVRAALAVALAAAMSFGAWRVVESREARATGADAAPAAPGEAPGVVRVDADDRARSGVRTAPLAAAQGPGLAQGFATVVDIAPLADLRTSAATAEAQLTAGEAKAAASNAAWQRAAALYKDGQNMSLAQAQAAEAAFRADAAAAAAARVQAQGARANLRQQFGPMLARASSSAASALIEGRTVLIQVTAPPGGDFSPPSLTVQTPAGGAVPARLLSEASRVDPRTQGRSYYFLAPAGHGLQAGMNVTIAWPAGPAAAGALAPRAAAVAWQGQWWIYQQTGEDTFRRTPIDVGRPLPGGYLVETLPVGAQVVTEGAQLMLSQELKPKSQASGGDDD